MYAAIEAARAGAQVLLADRSLIGRGGATVMAQMTVAAALGEETPDDWQPSLCRHARRRPRAVRRKARALLCEDAPNASARWMPGASAGRARTATSPRPPRRAMTGRAASMSISSTPDRRCRKRCARRWRAIRDPQSRRPVRRRSRRQRRRRRRRGRLSSRQRRAGDDRGQGDGAGDRRADAALPAQQRLGQYGRRRLCAGAARRRR
jgi:hypothetical protein